MILPLFTNFAGFTLQTIPCMLLCLLPFPKESFIVRRQYLISFFCIVLLVSAALFSSIICFPELTVRHGVFSLNVFANFFMLLVLVLCMVIFFRAVRESVWKKVLVLLLVIMVPVYVGLTVARNHDVEYLNGIFDMKNSSTPIFITQPYIYVANNFENFNCLVEQIAEHTYGVRMLFPVFALTGLKFIFPELTASPIYITKPELTTLTMFYDAYYDFGIVGVLLLALIIGFAARKLTVWIHKGGNPVAYLFYGQIAIYLGLAFFTTWFSNPTTWFWLALTTVMYLFVGYQKKEEDGRWRKGLK